MKIGLYPSGKTGRYSIHAVCRMEEYDLVITDQNVSGEFLKQAKELGVAVETAVVEGE